MDEMWKLRDGEQQTPGIPIGPPLHTGEQLCLEQFIATHKRSYTRSFVFTLSGYEDRVNNGSFWLMLGALLWDEPHSPCSSKFKRTWNIHDPQH